MASNIRAVIFDWAGTVVDYGSLAPVAAFVELFRRHSVELSAEQARGPMGLAKREHIRALMRECHFEGDLDRLYAEFIPLQIEMIGRHARVIPGVRQAVRDLRARDIRIGSTTGYTTEMMRALIPLAAADGFDPDCIVCSDEVPEGRPAPWMALQAAMRLGAYPMSACVKVGDTIADVAEGLNAGMWTAGVTKTGNEIGLAPDEFNDLPPDELQQRLNAAAERFRAAGCHYVIEDVSGIIPVVDDINERLERGDRP